MNLAEVRRRRLQNQHLSRPGFDDPAELVGWFGAVQAQDYLGALWGIGQRVRRGTESLVEQAIVQRKIVRTWPMRGTLHFVAAADVRWMLELCTPRIVRRMAPQHAREHGLDEEALEVSRRVLLKTLQGGRSLTRPALYQRLGEVGVPVEGQGGLQVLWRLSQEGLICFGPRENRQQTFVLLDEWLPPAQKRTREEALAELARRYFRAHGPASLADFTWWSGLTVADTRAAVGLVEHELEHTLINGDHYWFSSSPLHRRNATPRAHLLPAFDEYLVGYKERGAVLNPRFGTRLSALLTPAIEMDGEIVGTWGRRISGTAVEIRFRPFGRLTAQQKTALDVAAQRYASFVGKRITGS
jgi:hypothetical protein